jgi:hypothetical protein
MTDFTNTPTIGNSVTTNGITYKWNGAKWITATGAIVNIVTQSNNGTVDLSKGDFHKINTAPTTINFSNIANGSSKWVVELQVSAADVFDLSVASYDNVSFDLSQGSSGSVPTSLFFKPDGTEMYTADLFVGGVTQRSLSTAWDITTASVTRSFDISSQEDDPYGVAFKPDGTKMFVLGGEDDEVNEYSLSTAWDISTAAYVQNFSIASQDNNPRGFAFKPDGTKMFMIGASGDDVNEYSLSTAWDVSTAAYVQNFSVNSQENNPHGVTFRPDGTMMFVLGNTGDDVNEYSLSTAWDVSTAVYVQNFSISSEETNPYGIAFKPDGTKMFMTGSINNLVLQYSTTISRTITWPNNVIWENSTAPVLTTAAQTIILEFYTPDSGTTIYGIEIINIV